MGDKVFLLDETLKKWKGRRVALAVGSETSFTGILKDFDEEILILRDVADIVGNRGKELIVKIDDVTWLMCLE